jgi:hypothetical protein
MNGGIALTLGNARPWAGSNLDKYVCEPDRAGNRWGPIENNIDARTLLR